MQHFQRPTETTPADTAIAAIDLGSNSFHMIVARQDNNQLQIIDKLREMVRLGAGLNPDKTLDKDTAENAIACLERFGQRLRNFPTGNVRAVGTNTLRQVRDEGFLERAQQALGHSIEIISGREEARLVYLGVTHGLDTGDERRLVIDIGGGSTELIIGKRYDIFHRESLHMGCVSFSNRHFPDGKITRSRMMRAIIAGRLDIRPVKQLFNQEQWATAIGSSGTVRAIRNVVQAMGWSKQGITRQALKKLRHALIEQGHYDKLQLDGLSKERAPVFAGGVAVLSALFKSLNIKMMQVSDEALREGLLYEMVGEFHHRDIHEKTLKTITERYNLDKTQARRVEKTATQMLAQIKVPWALDKKEFADLLVWAARLHEIGLAISHSQFHKHGAYIVENADLSGFSRQQQKIMAILVRTHRRKISNEIFQPLAKALREPVKRLAILLRMAVLLHRGHSNTNKPKLRLQVNEHRIHLQFPEDWLDDHPLTVAELEREAKYLNNIDYALTFS